VLSIHGQTGEVFVGWQPILGVETDEASGSLVHNP